jgi:hypothetical protein
MTCEIVGFNNVPEKKPDRMPTPKAITTTLADAVTQTSNTTRIPFTGPNMPKGN